MLPTCTMDKIKRIQLTEDMSKLASEAGCSPLAAAVLSSRVGPDPNLMAEWLNLDLEGLLETLDLGPGVEESREIWEKSVPGKKVLVYGDYDVDGISSSALAVELAEASGAEAVRYYIPHRQKEGYGVQLSVVQKALSMGMDTLIVTDCGSKDVEPLSWALKNSMSVLVFDHHSLGGATIDLDSFVNPHRGGDSESSKLCATSVLWTWAYRAGIVPKAWLFDRIDLPALATISDCMALGKLNRALVKRGLNLLRNRPRAGMRKLCSSLKVNFKNLDENDLSMKVIPCLNAAGRLDYADLALSLILKGDDESLERLKDLNETRKELTKSISSALIPIIDESKRHVYFDEKWPVGLLSAVASRLCGSYDEGFALAGAYGHGIRGTIRVPEGGNAVGILGDLDYLLDAWGGHPFAAGFSTDESNWQELSRILEEKLDSIVPLEKAETALDFDPGNFDLSSWKDLRALGPFGTDNPDPLFYFPRHGGEKLLPLGKDGIHGKIDLGRASLIAFNGAKQHQSMKDIKGWLYRPALNYWNGRTDIQFIVEKIVVS